MWKLFILFGLLSEFYLINQLMDKIGFIHTFLFYLASGFLGKLLSIHFLANKNQNPSLLLKGFGGLLIMLPLLTFKLLGLILLIPGVSFLLLLGFNTFILNRLQQVQNFKWYPKSPKQNLPNDIIDTTAKRLD